VARWIGWVVVAAALAAMAFARLTDDKERRGREPDTAPVLSESSVSSPRPDCGARAGEQRVGPSAESL
jgi:hypothetical protein